ncbi:hypothetical protein HDU97_006732 [Phlyctochytrium planicorne]|nr:hypothetical protein HDU97_006732 [Phlyctochytrium planicorne]
MASSGIDMEESIRCGLVALMDSNVIAMKLLGHLADLEGHCDAMELVRSVTGGIVHEDDWMLATDLPMTLEAIAARLKSYQTLNREIDAFNASLSSSENTANEPATPVAQVQPESTSPEPLSAFLRHVNAPQFAFFPLGESHILTKNLAFANSINQQNIPPYDSIRSSRKRSRSPIKDLISVLPVGVLSFIFHRDRQHWDVVSNPEFDSIISTTEHDLVSGAWIERLVHPNDRSLVYSMLGYSAGQDASRGSDPPSPVLGKRFEYRVYPPSPPLPPHFPASSLMSPQDAMFHRSSDAKKMIWLSAENAAVKATDKMRGEESVIVHTIMDITPLKAAEVEKVLYSRATDSLHTQRALQAKRRKEEIDEFVDVMCHELRNPLNGIAGNVDLLKSGLEIRESILLELEETGTINSEHISRLRQQLRDDEESITAIHACAEHSKMVADDVLELGKFEEYHRQPLRQRPFDPKVVVSEVARMLGARASLKGLGIRINFPLEDIICFGDQQKLRQVVVNLVSNAIVHCDRGSITVTLDVTRDVESNHVLSRHETSATTTTPFAVNLAPPPPFTSDLPPFSSLPVEPPANATLRISVIDTGVGLTPEEINGLFRKFSQPTQRRPTSPSSPGCTPVTSSESNEAMVVVPAVDDEPKAMVSSGHVSSGGSGLGLLICKRLVESMGGTMSVQSTKGHGARFSFTVRIFLIDCQNMVGKNMVMKE